MFLKFEGTDFLNNDDKRSKMEKGKRKNNYQFIGTCLWYKKSFVVFPQKYKSLS